MTTKQESEVAMSNYVRTCDPDGATTFRWHRSDGTVERDERYRPGDWQDRADAALTFRWYRPDGSVEREEHYRDGDWHDPADGSPAVRTYWPDGSVASEQHYRAGVRIR